MILWHNILRYFNLHRIPEREYLVTCRSQKKSAEERSMHAKPVRPSKRESKSRQAQPTLSSSEPAGVATSPKKTEIKLTIGLDFGTSTIKCIVFAQVGDRRIPERFVVPIDGRALFPAICWEQKGNLFIGDKPRGPCREFRSPKVCLRCEILKEEYPDPTYRESNSSPFEISWAILSYCINRIRGHILKRFPAKRYTFDWEKDVFWNMGAPLDGMKHEHIRKHFAHLLWLSVNYGFSWFSQTALFSDLSGLHAILKKNTPPIKDSDGFVYVCNCFVFPEAHVAVNAFLQLGGNLEPGLYYVCDVGAGTTDIAFFRFAQNVEREVVFYDTSSTLAGGDLVAITLSELTNVSIAIANEKIIRGLSANDNDILSDVLRDLKEKISDGRKKAFGRAYTKEKRMKTWHEQFQGAAVMGGGSQIGDLQEFCVSPLKTGNGNETIRVDNIPLRKEMPIEATELHRIAFGLSIPPTQFYGHWRPDEVEPLEKVKQTKFDPFPFGNPYDI